MDKYIQVSLIASGFIAFLLFYLGPIARRVGLVDQPNSRKIHESNVPLIGGVCMVVAFLLAMLLMPFSLRDYRMLFFAVSALLIVGILDDFKDISASVRLVVQIVISVLLVTLSDIQVDNIGDIFSREVTQGLSVLSIPFTVIAIVGVINSVNMIDGHDGLAGITSLVSFSGLGYLCYRTGQHDYFAVFMLLACLGVVFLVFNLSLAGKDKQVFLGDAGSMFLGLILVYFLVVLSDLDVPDNFRGRQTVLLKTTAAPWIIGLPLFDMFASMIRRSLRMRSVFTADRGHVHHRLTDLGYSKYFVVVVLTLIHVGFVMVGLAGTILNWPDVVLFWPPFVILITYLIYTSYQENKLLSKPWKL